MKALLYITWEKCTLRQWLNKDFLNVAFTADEQELLATVTVFVQQNPEYGSSKYGDHPGKRTQDRVFLLSIDEFKHYFSSFNAGRCLPTKTAISNGAWTDDDTGDCCWWLRTPGKDTKYAAYIEGYGTNGINYYGTLVQENNTIRPVIVLKLL